MSTLISLSGKLIGRLTVLHREGDALPPRWRCSCSCGNTTIVLGAHLRAESIRSCGCLRREWARSMHRSLRTGNRVHGYTGHPLYRVWAGIQRRCENPRDCSYPWYGGKGVRMCEQWRHDPAAFVRWALDQGWTHEHRLCISRRGDLGDYSPENCELITRSQNSRDAAIRPRQRKVRR